MTTESQGRRRSAVGHFGAMVAVEVRALFTRGSGLAVLGTALVVGVATIAVLQVVQGAVSVDTGGGGALAQFNGVEAAGYALRARNFFVLPMFLLFATGSSFAAELAEHTLREQLVRPVSRAAVFAAKAAALLLLAAASLALTLIPALAGGLALFGGDGPIVDLLLGYAASLLSDAGLIGLGLLASTVVRGSGGVVVAVIAALIVDAGARAVLYALGAVGVAGLDGLRAALPGSALACWEGWSTAFTWQPFAGVAALIAAALGLAFFRFGRMDVP